MCAGANRHIRLAASAALAVCGGGSGGGVAGTALADTCVPAWVRDVTVLYDGGFLTDGEYLAAIRYLVQNGILQFGGANIGDPEMVPGAVARVVDGNTLYVDNVKIRPPPVDVKDSGDTAVPHAVPARGLCPAGSVAHYDVDGLQPAGPYGRTIAVVYCDAGISLNRLMIDFGLGWINPYYCKRSEFRYAEWTRGT